MGNRFNIIISYISSNINNIYSISTVALTYTLKSENCNITIGHKCIYANYCIMLTAIDL